MKNRTTATISDEINALYQLRREKTQELLKKYPKADKVNGLENALRQYEYALENLDIQEGCCPHCGQLITERYIENRIMHLTTKLADYQRELERAKEEKELYAIEYNTMYMEIEEKVLLLKAERGTSGIWNNH